MPNQNYPYDVALSFAGEDRKYAEELAQALKARDIDRVFYDKYEEITLWGKNLYTHLSEVYQKQACFCVMFLSQHYKDKLWTNHEREAAQARAFQENKEYILPIRLDNTEIPGILPTLGYLKWSNADSMANNIAKKLQERNLDTVVSKTKSSTDKATNPSNQTSSEASVTEQVTMSCLTKLSQLTNPALRHLITSRMGLSEIGTIWFDTLETKMNDYMNGHDMEECVIELLDRTKNRNLQDKLINNLCKARPDLADYVDP